MIFLWLGGLMVKSKGNFQRAERDAGARKRRNGHGSYDEVDRLGEEWSGIFDER